MSEEAIVDDAIAGSLAHFLTPTSSFISPTVASGVSSDEVAGAPTREEEPSVCAKDDQNYQCPICGKVYMKKSKNYYVNHIFLHNISDANIRRLTLDSVIPFVDEYVLEILEEIRKEPRIPEEKLAVVEDILKSRGSENWVNFTMGISSEIINALTKRVKIMPTSQYEEVLTSLNRSLNDRDFFSDLKVMCQMCVTESLQESKYFGMLVFRITFRLCEKFQLLVMKEMVDQSHSSVTVATVDEAVRSVADISMSSEKEIKAFEGHMGKIVKTYYSKISHLSGPVWSARAICVRKEFVVSGDGDFVTPREMLDMSLWLDGSLRLSEKALNFFLKVEQVIRKVMRDLKAVTKEAVLEKIISCPQYAILNDWCFLTQGYFAEQDAVTFMRDIISIVVNLSIRLEEKRMLALEQRDKRLPKFSLRGDLKCN